MTSHILSLKTALSILEHIKDTKGNISAKFFEDLGNFELFLQLAQRDINLNKVNKQIIELKKRIS